ncbi:DUF2798 domain-containing protein [Pseudoxanthomonas japonensis]|uniref:DUF2798 domain-containing protein n=1 Tax=Pseudoxanthomonas japonensis TaxID=69284 RepID=UPI003748B0A7
MTAPVANSMFVDRLLPGCMAFFMSALVTCTATWVNSPSMAGVAVAFLRAWAVSLPVAVVAAYLTRPLALRVAKAMSMCIARLPRRAH